MSLAAVLGDEVTIELNGRPVVLRPTLRAGIAAHELCGGYGPLIEKLTEVDLWTMAALVHRATGKDDPTRLWSAMWAAGAQSFVAPLTDFVLILANGGARPAPGDDGRQQSKSITHEEHLARLFKIGTGWMGWTPAATLDAPMASIVSAYVGRQDFLASIFGGQGSSSASNIPLAEKLRAGMAVLGTKKVLRS